MELQFVYVTQRPKEPVKESDGGGAGEEGWRSDTGLGEGLLKRNQGSIS